MYGINCKFLEELRIALKCGSNVVVSEKLIAKEIKGTETKTGLNRVSSVIKFF